MGDCVNVDVKTIEGKGKRKERRSKSVEIRPLKQKQKGKRQRWFVSAACPSRRDAVLVNDADKFLDKEREL